MRAPATPPRRKWPLIVIGLIVAALIAYAIFAIATNRSTPQATQTPSTSHSAPVDAAPTGCLGGAEHDVSMLLEAAATAPHTTSGAVEFATAYVRWMHRFPNPTADEALQAKDVFSSANGDFDLVAYLATQPNLSGGIVEDGRPFHSSTVPGVWYLESAAEDEVTVSIGTGFVIDGQLSASLRGSITVTVVWEGDSWRFDTSDGTRTTEDLFTIGTPFIGGC